MGSRVHEAINKQLIPRGSVPSWLKKEVQYEVITGSVAYGASSDTSDMDIYGWCIPPKRFAFPYSSGYIYGFDKPPTFDQWQLHHVKDPSANNGKGQEYDFTIYSIIRFCKLCMDCNPNMLDSLYVPERCILYSTSISEMIRQNRDLFLCKKAFHGFTGYLHAQMSKLNKGQRDIDNIKAFEKENKIPHETKQSEIDDMNLPADVKMEYHNLFATSKRLELRKTHGFDVKSAYHGVRLACQVEQILELGTMDLTRDREMYKAIRAGQWTIDQVRSWIAQKEISLNKLYSESKLRSKPAVDEIKDLMMNCMEQYYGSISEAEYANPDKYKTMVEKIEDIINNVR